MPKVQIRMERDFDAFGDKEREEFFSGLSDLTGASMSELQFGSFRKGCVIYEVTLTDEQTKKLLDFVLRNGITDRTKALNGTTPIEIRAYLEFCEGHSVISIRNLDLDKAIKTSKSSQDKPVVVFLHGWRSDPSAYGELPKKLEQRTGLSVICLQYPTGKLGGYPGLVSLAQYLDNEIAIRTRYSKELALVGHSMGGLLARRLLVGSSDGTALVGKNVKQLTLIASPGVGSTLASVANIATLFTQRQLRDLSKDSAFMQDLGPRWTSWMRRNVPDHVRVRAIFGELDRVVPRAEAMLFDDRPVPILDGDHSTVVNPSAEDAKITLLNTIEHFLSEAKLI